jgi:hypothetical protein
MNWPVHFDAAWLAAEQLECLMTDRDDLAVVAIDRYNGRFV